MTRTVLDTLVGTRSVTGSVGKTDTICTASWTPFPRSWPRPRAPPGSCWTCSNLRGRVDQLLPGNRRPTTDPSRKCCRAHDPSSCRSTIGCPSSPDASRGSRLPGVLGRGQHIDDRGIDRAGGHPKSLGRLVPLQLVEQLPAQIVGFEQVAEAAYRVIPRLVGAGWGSTVKSPRLRRQRLELIMQRQVGEISASRA
jgi:hypothetical protein